MLDLSLTPWDMRGSLVGRALDVESGRPEVGLYLNYQHCVLPQSLGFPVLGAYEAYMIGRQYLASSWGP